MSENESNNFFSLGNKILVVVVGVLLLASVGAAAYFWNEAQEAKNQTPEAVAERNQEESNRVIEKLNTVLLTESDKKPTVARIDNAQTLKDANPDFYKNAQNGDYLILYPQRAIIFRESEVRVINVAPIINPTAGQDQDDSGSDSGDTDDAGDNGSEQ